MPKCHFCHILFVKTSHRVKESRNKLHLIMREVDCVYRVGWVCWRLSMETTTSKKALPFIQEGTSIYISLVGTGSHGQP